MSRKTFLSSVRSLAALTTLSLSPASYAYTDLTDFQPPRQYYAQQQSPDQALQDMVLTVLDGDCDQVSFDQGNIICEDKSYCKNYWRADCGRKYCEEYNFRERWSFTPAQIHQPTFIKQKDNQAFPYALHFSDDQGAEHNLPLKYEETAGRLMPLLEKKK